MFHILYQCSDGEEYPHIQESASTLQVKSSSIEEEKLSMNKAFICIALINQIHFDEYFKNLSTAYERLSMKEEEFNDDCNLALVEIFIEWIQITLEVLLFKLTSKTSFQFTNLQDDDDTEWLHPLEWIEDKGIAIMSLYSILTTGFDHVSTAVGDRDPVLESELFGEWLVSKASFPFTLEWRELMIKARRTMTEVEEKWNKKEIMEEMKHLHDNQLGDAITDKTIECLFIHC